LNLDIFSIMILIKGHKLDYGLLNLSQQFILFMSFVCLINCTFSDKNLREFISVLMFLVVMY